jgi:hypothetical protein
LGGAAAGSVTAALKLAVAVKRVLIDLERFELERLPLVADESSREPPMLRVRGAAYDATPKLTSFCTLAACVDDSLASVRGKARGPRSTRRPSRGCPRSYPPLCQRCRARARPA